MTVFSKHFVFWKVVSDMVQSGGIVAVEAIDNVYQVYGGAGISVSEILSKMMADKKRPEDRHPDLFVGGAAAGTTGNTTQQQ